MEEDNMEQKGIMEEENEEEEKIHHAPKQHKKKLHHKVKKAIKNDPWKLVSAVLLVLALFLIFGKGEACYKDKVGAEAAGEKALTFINDKLIRPGTTATLEGTEETNCFYKVMVDYQGNKIESYITKDGVIFFPAGYDIDVVSQAMTEEEETEAGETTMEGTFNVLEDKEVCKEDDKPIIRMFASSGCGYCKWNKPMFMKVAKEYMDEGKIIAYLWEDGKNILSDEEEEQPPEEIELYREYGFSGVPAFVMGCKYTRGGAANIHAENGEEVEEAELRSIIEKLLAS
jgi:thioredoxin-related protein